MQSSRIFQIRLELVTRFLGIGLFSTLCHWAAMALLVVFGVNATLATCAGAAVGALINYFLQYHLTFACQTTHRVAVPSYLLVVAVAWIVNLVCFYWLSTLWLLAADVSQLITSALVAAMNFVLYKKVVFHVRNSQQSEA